MKKLFLLMLLPLCSCNTTQRATIEGNVIRHSDIGFNGYRVEFPDGYEHVPASEIFENYKELSFPRLAHATSLPQQILTEGINKEYSIVYANAECAIAFNVYSLMIRGNFSRMTQAQRKAILEKNFNEDRPSDFKNGQTLYRRTENIEGRWVGITASSFPLDGVMYAHINAIEPGSLNEVFSVVGVSELSNIGQLESDIFSVLKTLDYR